MSAEYAGSVATIHLNVLKKNLDYLKRRSGVNNVIAVVKADAYSHGAVEVSGYLEDHVSRFAVASVDEGIELRAAGISSPVLVFGVPNDVNAEAYTRHGLTATISHTDHFSVLKPGTGYQINFDSGMRRAGIYPRQLEETRKMVEKHRDLRCEGFFSHYATADNPGSRFAGEQHEIFRHLRSQMPAEIPAHMSNSAAVLHYDFDHFDMIRVGIGLTGYAPGTIQSGNLTPVLDWETEAAIVREIVKGDPVSYGGIWRAPSRGFLATLPVGYADGVPRALNHRLQVEIGGEMFPLAGSITMDYCMIFLGDRYIRPGTPVQLMGNRGWRANEWASQAGTITHEILCGLTPRVRRIYRS